MNVWPLQLITSSRTGSVVWLDLFDLKLLGGAEQVKKKHGPAFHAEFRPLTRCPECRGQGETQGIFHKIPCGACGASGLVDKETGEALAPEDLVIQLRLRLRKLADENRRMRQQLAEDPGRGYGPMGMRYHGD